MPEPKPKAEVGDIIDYLGRPYKVERRVRDGSRDKFILTPVRQVGQIYKPYGAAVSRQRMMVRQRAEVIQPAHKATY